LGDIDLISVIAADSEEWLWVEFWLEKISVKIGEPEELACLDESIEGMHSSNIKKKSAYWA
jgi:hypothetical protein